ncbi:hypothetical protein EYF80_000409 [Liparis tanakae]|uniref:Uncharacterized protein n=1 Tax=Liparis tanakae TaxID=230148 RepID=A0A4Z2JGM1_9TELE|nr:hypothetical protein EYF80_000409 [Liparis tanakae]
MPFHWPFSSWEPYLPSGTRRISYVKPRTLASSESKSTQYPSKRSFPTNALSDFLSMTYGSSCADPKDQMKSNVEEYRGDMKCRVSFTQGFTGEVTYQDGGDDEGAIVSIPVTSSHGSLLGLLGRVSYSTLQI